jgi:hypothetical protein
MIIYPLLLDDYLYPCCLMIIYALLLDDYLSPAA